MFVFLPTLALLRFLTASGLCRRPESVVSCETRYPLVLGPFRVLHVGSVGHRYRSCRSCPLPQILRPESGLQRVIPLQPCVGFGLATVCDLYPPGRSPSREFPRGIVFCCFQQIPRSVLTAGGFYPIPRSAFTSSLPFGIRSSPPLLGFRPGLVCLVLWLAPLVESDSPGPV